MRWGESRAGWESPEGVVQVLRDGGRRKKGGKWSEGEQRHPWTRETHTNGALSRNECSEGCYYCVAGVLLLVVLLLLVLECDESKREESATRELLGSCCSFVRFNRCEARKLSSFSIRYSSAVPLSPPFDLSPSPLSRFSRVRQLPWISPTPRLFLPTATGERCCARPTLIRLALGEPKVSPTWMILVPPRFSSVISLSVDRVKPLLMCTLALFLSQLKTTFEPKKKTKLKSELNHVNRTRKDKDESCFWKQIQSSRINRYHVSRELSIFFTRHYDINVRFKGRTITGSESKRFFNDPAGFLLLTIRKKRKKTLWSFIFFSTLLKYL